MGNFIWKCDVTYAPGIFPEILSKWYKVDREKKNILDRQQIASQWGLQSIFRMHNSDPTPQGVENRNILLRFKCVLTALHVNCMILFDKVL
jgi:hypothetical protein